MQKFFIPHPKIISSLAGLLLVHLLTTYLSISHFGTSDKVIQLPPAKSSDQAGFNPVPLGNIFVFDRAFARTEEKNEPEKKQTETEGNFRLGSIIRDSSQVKAVFVSEQSKLILGVGEHHSPLGEVKSIIDNTVITKRSGGELRSWQLFPTFKVDSPNLKKQESKTK